MKKLLATLTLCTLVVLPENAFARTDSPKDLAVPITATLSAVGMDAARTLTIANDQLAGLSLLVIYYFLKDADDSVTAFSVSCAGLHTSGGKAYTLPTCIYDSANTRWSCEAAPFYWVPSDETSSDYKFNIQRVDVSGIDNVTCTITPTGGDAAPTDVLQVHARATVD